MESNLNMIRIINKKGTVTLEAAIFLPIFIVGVLTVAYLMKYIFLQENILFRMCEESKKLGRNAYYLDSAMLFPIWTENVLKKENPEVQEIHTAHFFYLVEEKGIDNLIRFEVDYWMDIRLPIQLYQGLPGKETVVFRGMKGKTVKLDAKPFTEMEQEDSGRNVWIFPREGEKYHRRDCPFIQVYPSQTILTDEIRNRYRACTTCDASSLKMGSQVYCFYRAGETYHEKECNLVVRYVIEIPENVAADKGYQPCKTCEVKRNAII